MLLPVLNLQWHVVAAEYVLSHAAATDGVHWASMTCPINQPTCCCAAMHEDAPYTAAVGLLKDLRARNATCKQQDVDTSGEHFLEASMSVLGPAFFQVGIP